MRNEAAHPFFILDSPILHWSGDPVDGPLRRLTDERFRVAQGAAQRRQRRRVAAVAQGDGRVAQQAASLRPGQGRAAEAAAESFFRKAEQLYQVDGLQV